MQLYLRLTRLCLASRSSLYLLFPARLLPLYLDPLRRLLDEFEPYPGRRPEVVGREKQGYSGRHRCRRRQRAEV